MSLEDLIEKDKTDLFFRLKNKASGLYKRNRMGVFSLGVLGGTMSIAESMFSGRKRAFIEQRIEDTGNWYMSSALSSNLDELAYVALVTSGVLLLRAYKDKKDKVVSTWQDALFNHPFQATLLFGLGVSAIELMELYKQVLISKYNSTTMPNLFPLYAGVTLPAMTALIPLLTLGAGYFAKTPKLVNAPKFLLKQLGGFYALLAGSDKFSSTMHENADPQKSRTLRVLDSLKKDPSNGALAFFRGLEDFLDSDWENTKRWEETPAWFISKKSNDPVNKLTISLSDFILGRYKRSIEFMETALSKFNSPELSIAAAAFYNRFRNDVLKNPSRYDIEGLKELTPLIHLPYYLDKLVSERYEIALKELMKTNELGTLSGRASIVAKHPFLSKHTIFLKDDSRNLDYETAMLKRLAKELPELSFPENLCRLNHQGSNFAVLEYLSGTPLAEVSDLEAYKKVARAQAVFDNTLKGVDEDYFAIMRSRLPDSIKPILDTQFAKNLQEDLTPNSPRRDAHGYNYIVGDDGQITAIDFRKSRNEHHSFDLVRLTAQGSFAGDETSSHSILTEYANASNREPSEVIHSWLQALPLWSLQSAFTQVEGPLGTKEQKAKNIHLGKGAASQLGWTNFDTYANTALNQL